MSSSAGGFPDGGKKSEDAAKTAPAEPSARSLNLPKQGKPAASAKAEGSADTGPASAKSEEEKVRIVAEGLAKKTPKAGYMRICHDKKQGEWWITLYEDQGFRLGLVQYIWSKTQDKADPFLVERYIPKTDLKARLAESTPEKPCKAFEATEKGWIAAQSGSSLSPEPVPASWSQSKPALKGHGSPTGSGAAAKPSARLPRGAAPVPAGHSASRVNLDNDFMFLYGSEMDHPALLTWLESHGYDSSLIHDAAPARVDGYGFVWDYYSQAKGGGTANIEPQEDSSVWGLLITADPQLVKAFDRRQGHPTTYSRGDRRIPVRRMPEGAMVSAWLYVAKPNQEGRRDVWPTSDYKKLIVDAARFWDFPPDYVNKIERWRTR